MSFFTNTTNNLFISNNLNELNFNIEVFKTNEKKIIKDALKCNHIGKYCAFCLKEKIGPICYDCIYQYNLNNNDCIPMKENFDFYKKVYENQFVWIKEKVKKLYDTILKELDKFKLDSSDNIETLTKKIDLSFELPIEVPLEERIEI